jgi:DNA-binding MarR family transcriptional regulator
VALTEAGAKAFETLAAGHEAEVSKLFAGLSDSDLDRLTDILKRVGGSK